MRCLVSFGFLAEDDEAERRSRGNRVRLGPLRYAHFEIEVNTDTPVVRHNRVEEIVFVLGGLTLAVLSVLYQLWFG